MEVICNIGEVRQKCSELRAHGKSIGFVPTMGFLHEGHLSLIRRAVDENDCVVVSIFVNKMQFGKNEDYNDYPKDIERDKMLASNAGAHILFIPDDVEMYPDGFCSSVSVNRLTDVLDGAFRPGHFTGVTTVLTKFFNIIMPERAYFGQKDAQQFVVVKRMVEDLNINVEIVQCPTVREQDNLAMSSRNILLQQDERQQAASISKALFDAKQLILDGCVNAAEVEKHVYDAMSAQPLCQVDYVEVIDLETFLKVDEIKGPVMVAIAVRFTSTRLIDNVIVEI